MSSLTKSDVDWLITLNSFSQSEKQWLNDPNRNLLHEKIRQSIDIHFQVIKRTIEMKPHTPENREKILRKIEHLSFLMGIAESEMGNPIDQITL